MYDIERRISFPGVDRTAEGDPNGDQVFSYLGLGYDRKLGNLITGPIVSVQYTRLLIDSYTETGAGALNLTIDEQEAESLQGGFGWHWAYQIKSEDMIFLPNVAATYQREFMNDPRGITATIAGGSSFQTVTSNPTRDFVRVGAGLTALVAEDVTLNIGYNAQVLDKDYFEQGVTGGVRVGF
jgi:outer membrane autotransporter protein